MSAVLPNLGSGGWISDINAQVTTLLAEAMVADESQSSLYEGKVTSIAGIIQEYQTNPSQLATQLEAALFNYYSNYFPGGVNANVTIPNVLPTDGKYPVNLSIIVTVNGVDYSVAIIAMVENGALKQVINEVNR